MQIANMTNRVFFFPQMAISDAIFLRLTHFLERRCVRLTHIFDENFALGQEN